MPLIQDLRAAGLTVQVRDATRGRTNNVSRIVFAPSRDTATPWRDQADLFELDEDFMGAVSPTGILILYSVGPNEPKSETHPNRRRSANFAMLTAPNATRSNWTPPQRQTVTTAAPIMRTSFGPEIPEQAGR